MGVTLKGLAWDHRRCWGPLEASIPAYCAAHPDIDIRWDRRSLFEFGEGRLDEAVRTHDLVVFDHPFVGEVARDGLLVPLELVSRCRSKSGFCGRLGRQVVAVLSGRWSPMGAADRCRGAGRGLPARPPRRLRRARAAHARGRRRPWPPGRRRGQVARPAAGADRRHVPDHHRRRVDRPRDRRVAGGLPRPRCRRRNRRSAARDRGDGPSGLVVVESDPLLRAHDPPRRRRLCPLRLRLRQLRLARQRRRISASPTFRRRRRGGRCLAAPALVSAPSRKTATRRSPMRSISAAPTTSAATTSPPAASRDRCRPGPMRRSTARRAISSPIRSPPFRARICAEPIPASSPSSAPALIRLRRRSGATSRRAISPTG